MQATLRRLRGWSKLLRRIYNPGIKKHEPIYVLGCANCGRASADIRMEEHAWDGWTVVPLMICPACKETVHLPETDEYPAQADRREKFEGQINQIKRQIRTGGKL
jgi:hypothetical protein